MEDKLNFSLPQPKKGKSSFAVAFSILAVVLIALGIVNIAVNLSKRQTGSPIDIQGLSAEQTKQLATKLTQRNLYEQAARLWQDYLASGHLTDRQQARTLFQIGVLMEKADRYADAIEYYYRSEAAAKLNELESQINAHLKNCFERLGKFSALRYEMMERTSLKTGENQGGKVVAEIGAEKITETDLDDIIERNIDNQLSAMAAFLSPEQLNEQKRNMLQRYKDPQVKEQFLQSWLAEEILYRQALEENLSQKPEVKKQLGDLTRTVLSRYLMDRELASKIHITETDLQTYYAANKDKYAEPTKARISHILVDSKDQADELIKRINNGEDFENLAKEFSIDKSTKEKGGKIETDVTKGSYIPGIGESEELNKKIFSAAGATLLDEPFKTDKGWEIVKVDEIEPEKQKSFDQVRQQIMVALMNQKRQDVQQDYIKQLMDKYNVVVHTSALTGQKETQPQQEDAVNSK